MAYHILVVDDEVNIRTALRDFYQEEGFDVSLASNGKEALTELLSKEIDFVVTDLRMSIITGQQLLEYVSEKYPSIPVLVVTGYGSVENAVKAIQSGAYDFLAKPINLERLLFLTKQALKVRQLALRNKKALKEGRTLGYSRHTIVRKSEIMKKIISMTRQVAKTSASVLISGESGVGKELIADMLHEASSRIGQPIVKVHCAALSETLLESELFGHEKGAFTGASHMRRGRFELANRGSIFLDEISEINSSTQVKLLRVLQERSFERVGGEETIQVNVRIIAATNKDLRKEVQEGRFREDLFYRLSVVNITVPPLRDRSEDIMILSQFFLQEFSKENGKVIVGFDKNATQVLEQYPWPGNVRELKNCIESAVVLNKGKYIRKSDLPTHIANNNEQVQDIVLHHGISLRDAEREIIYRYLINYRWNKTRVAQVLKIGRKTLHNKIREYAIRENAPLQQPSHPTAE